MREEARCGRGRSAGVLAALLALLLGAASGCVYHHHHPPAVAPRAQTAGYGPPPQAPAHGYRYRHPSDGVSLVYDAGLGVYAVVDWPDTYWYSGRYLSWADGVWRTSTRIRGTWVVVSRERVPAKLVAKHAKHREKALRQHDRHPGPAKHDH
jgi:hypothetical protein